MGLKNLISTLFRKNEIQADSSKELGLKVMLIQWINKLENYAPPKEIIALNFGLFESNNGFMIYLTGSKVYDISNDDWASVIDYEPEPKYKYLLLKNAEISNLGWNAVLQIVQVYLKEIINDRSDYNLFKSRITTTGFDDGELIVVNQV